MKRHTLILAASMGMLLSSTSESFGQKIDNPVIPVICDCGVLRYNGSYHIGGVHTLGSFYISEDLVNWRGPEHVFSMDNQWVGPAANDSNIHANDMRYIDGKFHLYWSVNHWGKERTVVHIAHAESDKVLGPYVEPDKETWLDSRIDPMLFRDDDGSLYLYHVKFTEGNTIWAQKMSDPRTQSGTPVCQFDALPDTWESADNKVAEGPWVIKHNSKYYMVYNANHTGTDWGNYQLGVAVSDSPTGFNHGSKYSYPVMTGNQIPFEDKYRDILKYGESYTPLFKYSEENLPAGWTEKDFDDREWKEGEGGFGPYKIKGSWCRTANTIWSGDRLCIRKHFTVNDPSSSGNLGLRLLHGQTAKAWLNGKLIYDNEKGNFSVVNLPEECSKLLVKGDNVLAVESHRSGRRGNYVECALFDMGKDKADDILFTPGQPNLVKGPNGIEWWLVYMANKNNEPRGQYVSRAHFSADRLYFEPISSSNTKEYVSTPSKPQVFEQFEGGSAALDGKKMIDRKLSSSTYSYETMLKTDGKLEIGICSLDEETEFGVVLDAGKNSLCVNGVEHSLPERINWKVLNEIVLKRNGKVAELTIDGLKIDACSKISLPSGEKGVPFVRNVSGKSEIGTITYTIGWEEYKEDLNGWKALKGDFGGDNYLAVKAEPAENYDFSLMLKALSEAGAYPVWVDEKNNVKVSVNHDRACMDVTVCKKGKSQTQTFPLERTEPYYKNMTYSDFMMHIYTMDSPVVMDRILLPESMPDGRRCEELFSKLTAEYRLNGKWHPLEMKTSADSKYCTGEFSPTRMDALRFMNKQGNDRTNYIYRILGHELVRDCMHLHFIRENDLLVIRMDGKEVCRTSLKGFAASQVGLFSNGAENDADGIVYFQK